MIANDQNFIFHKAVLMTPLESLAPKALAILPDLEISQEAKAPNQILVVAQKKGSVPCEKNGGHYFMGGLPALMPAVRLLQENPSCTVTYVNDGQLKKSTQSAHQGHVHPTEWTTPELGSWQLAKIILRSMHLLPAIAPDDVLRYSYIHFPLSKMRPGLFIRNMAFRFIHTILSKNGVSEDDRWQCEAVRASLAFHKALSDEIEAAGDEPTFAYGWRLIWSADKKGIEQKKVLWNELGIKTEDLSQDELRKHTLLKDDVPLYGLKVLGDGKFFSNVDQKITKHLSKKYPNFSMRKAAVVELYVDETTNEPFAVLEEMPDGARQYVAVESFYGSTGHNQVFKIDSKRIKKKPMWDEVPVTGVSSLWVCTVAKSELLKRFGNMSDGELVHHVKQLVGAANLTNLHTTVWNACVDNDVVYIAIRATEGANFNSDLADPNDLANMKANIERFFIGSWQIITAGSCVRKTATPNVPELKEHFVHGLSGIGFSFSAAPREMLMRTGVAPSTFKLFVKLGLDKLSRS